MSILKHMTLREKVVEAIRNKIIRQELKPGERIIEQDLAREFHTSRGPIREALRDLENEGLIEYRRNAGCTVKEISLKDSYEIYMLRTVYECMAVRLIGGNIPESVIRQLETIVDQMEELSMDDYEKIVRYDNAFHECIVKSAGMPRIHKAWLAFAYGNIPASYSENLDKEKRLKHQPASHGQIVDYCKLQDAEKICREISDHYWRTIDRIMDERNIPLSDRVKQWNII